MKPNVISADVQSILNARIGDEYKAFYHYRAAANYCKGAGYKYAGAYFEKEAENELEHAKGIEAYLVDWNAEPVLFSIGSAPIFTSLVEVINASYALEYALYEAYEKDSVTLLDANEVAAFDFLQKYRTIQNESVAEYSDMLNELELIDADDKFQVYYFEKRVFNK